MSQNTELTVASHSPIAPLSAFGSPEGFELVQRMAKMLAESALVPDTYRKNLPDCVIALEMANRIGANPIAVMQNLYIVHGKPAWSSQFLISCINASGKFSPLRYATTGTKGTDTWGCVAWAVDRSGERLESPEVTLAMAKAEGWYSKNGSKWKTMPELMLRYRAATLFARTYAPELTMGIHTEDEVIDIAPVVTDPVARAKPAKPAKPLFASKDKESTPAQPEPEPEPEPDSIPGAESPGETTDAPATGRFFNYPKALLGLAKLEKLDESDLLTYLRQTGAIDESMRSLDECSIVSPKALKNLYDAWAQLIPQIKAASK